MYYLVESNKTFDQTVADLESVLEQQGFGMLAMYDLGGSLRSKGIESVGQCKVFEICNQDLLEKILLIHTDKTISGSNRITVFTENGKTKIVVNKQVQINPALLQNEMLTAVEELEKKLIEVLEAAK